MRTDDGVGLAAKALKAVSSPDGCRSDHARCVPSARPPARGRERQTRDDAVVDDDCVASCHG
jgi:hypothetical protein